MMGIPYLKRFYAVVLATSQALDVGLLSARIDAFRPKRSHSFAGLMYINDRRLGERTAETYIIYGILSNALFGFDEDNVHDGHSRGSAVYRCNYESSRQFKSPCV